MGANLNDNPLVFQETVDIFSSAKSIETMRVSSHGRTAQLAGAIAGFVRAGTPIELRAVGAAAVNLAVKAVSTARTFLEEDQLDLAMQSRMDTVIIEDEEKTAVFISVLVIKK